MSKEIIRPDQFGKVDMMETEQDIDVSLNEEQLLELTELYEGFFSNCKPGNVVTGKIVEIQGATESSPLDWNTVLAMRESAFKGVKDIIAFVDSNDLLPKTTSIEQQL